jgi:hypothetical protein
MPKSPTELSLREILDRYSGDKELLKVILEAKCLEDKVKQTLHIILRY